MAINEIADLALKIAGGIGFPSVIAWAIVGRRRDQSEVRVAERTENAVVAKADIGTVEATLIAVGKAFEMERVSLTRQVRELSTQVEEGQRRFDLAQHKHDEEVAGLTQLLAARNTEITGLREDLLRMAERVAKLEKRS